MGRNEKSLSKSNQFGEHFLGGNMIFLTVGTHEQPFNRLIEKMDSLKKDGLIEEDVIIQTGFSTYIPNNCRYDKFFGHDIMKTYVQEARIVITHGGPSSFIMPLQVGKIPIVVPRQKRYDEHVNDHQVDFVEQVEKRQKNIIVVKDIESLADTIINYDDIVNRMNKEISSNNDYFNNKLQEIVEQLFSKRKR